MTINEIVTYIWANHTKICSEIAQLFWITYTLILPQLSWFSNGVPEPWNNILIIIATLLTAYGFKNSLTVQGATVVAKKCFVKDISGEIK